MPEGDFCRQGCNRTVLVTCGVRDCARQEFDRRLKEPMYLSVRV